MMKQFVSVAFTAVLCVGAVAPLLARSRSHRVVFALASSDEADWRLTVGNLHNLVHGFGSEPYEVELVAYGPGLSFLKKTDPESASIVKLESSQAHFVACETEMKKQDINVSELIEGVTTTPSGIVEVVRKHEQGWAYIKAGR